MRKLLPPGHWDEFVSSAALLRSRLDVPVDAVALFSIPYFHECFSSAFLSPGALITQGPVPSVLCINSGRN